MSEERDYEKEALADGWNPNFEGEGKKDAKTFVEDGEKISGMLKNKIGHLEERIDALTQTNAEFKQYTDKQRQNDAKENKRLVAELEAVKAQAITDGDGVAAVKAERDIQDLKVEDPSPQVDPELERLAREWGTANEWYGKDQELTEYAEFIYPRVIADGYTGKAYYDEMTRRVKSQHPEKFKNPNRNKAGSVESGGDKGGESKDQTWANLPAADKAVANRFIKDMPGFTKEQFLAEYDWE